MANKKSLIDDELSIDTLSSEEVELISDTSVLERLSDEAKEQQDQRLLALKESVMSTVDQRKLPMALEQLDAIGFISEVLTDKEKWAEIKENISKPSEMKYLAETQKILIQNVQALTRVDSVNENGDASEVQVNLLFSSSGSATQIKVKK